MQMKHQEVRNTLGITSHRPWPLPRRPWAIQMQWLDLLFLHWPVSPELVRPLIPATLTLDTFEGAAWIGVVPFRMANVRFRMAPPIPTATNFEELNVRTYVRLEDRAGVWFTSLDAASRLAVMGARISCNLPYFHAEMSLTRHAEVIHYRSRRIHSGAPQAEFVARYWPTAPVAASATGSLDRWLTERYCLYSAGRGGRVYRLDVHHHPWPLQKAAVEIERNTMVSAAGIALPAETPTVHFASRLNVLGWRPIRAIPPGAN
jgi:uncharacterized protein